MSRISPLCLKNAGGLLINQKAWRIATQHPHLTSKLATQVGCQIKGNYKELLLKMMTADLVLFMHVNKLYTSNTIVTVCGKTQRKSFFSDVNVYVFCHVQNILCKGHRSISNILWIITFWNVGLGKHRKKWFLDIFEVWIKELRYIGILLILMTLGAF
jgi:hypothetical protein